MIKPEKRKLEKDYTYLLYDKGYNHAYNEWEKYHNEKIEKIELKSLARLDGWNRANKKIAELLKLILKNNRNK